MSTTSPKRYASIIELNPEKEAYYRELHAAVWPAVLKMIEKVHIQNYSIYVAPIQGKKYLFSYFEYTGTNFDEEMKLMAADAETQRWWVECKPCQIPLENRNEGQWWMDLEEVFHFNPA